MTIALERPYYPLIINVLNLQEHLVLAGSSGFSWRYIIFITSDTAFACRKQVLLYSIVLRAPSYDVSANVGLYPLFPLKSCFGSHLPLFTLLEEKYKI